MRIHQITCPKCGSGLKSKAGIPVGQTVPCPRCQTKFPVEAPDEPDIVDDADLVDNDDVVEELEVMEPAPKKKGPPPVPAIKPAARRRVEDDETEEEEPLRRKKSKRRPVDDTEEEEPVRRKKKRRRDEEEEEENLYLRLKHNIWVRVITLVVLLGILAVVAYLYYDLKIRQPAEESRSGSSSSSQVDDGR